MLLPNSFFVLNIGYSIIVVLNNIVTKRNILLLAPTFNISGFNYLVGGVFVIFFVKEQRSNNNQNHSYYYSKLYSPFLKHLFGIFHICRILTFFFSLLNFLMYLFATISLPLLNPLKIIQYLLNNDTIFLLRQ